MALPDPEPGLVIQYGYLWRHEAERGLENARYPRPCAVVVAHRRLSSDAVEVVVAPFTTQPPPAERSAVEVPPRVRRSLGLTERTWAMMDEVNVFTWPGFDLEPNASGEIAWDHVPPAFHAQLKAGLLAAAREGRLSRTPR